MCSLNYTQLFPIVHRSAASQLLCLSFAFQVVYRREEEKGEEGNQAVSEKGS